MPDATYDAVIVGGGHHATILACYLQKAGLKTAIFERWHEMGGGACGEELPLPGFIQNVCAHFTRFYAHPAYQDFNLREYGLVYTFPERNEAWVFPDGRYMLGEAVFKVVDPYTGKAEFSEKNAQHNVNEVARFSQKDAATVEDISQRFRSNWITAFRRYRYSPPEEWGEKDPLEELYSDPKDGLDPKYAYMTVGELACDLFESPEMRTFFMRAFQTSNGLMPEDPPGPYNLLHVLGLVLSLEAAAIVIGGTHSITHALLRAFEDLGGKFYVLHEVEKILVENGVAKGIRLKNGSEIAAKIVISDLSINLTFDLLGKENVPRDLWDEVEKLLDTAYERTQLFWGNIALYEKPEYPANPDLGMVPRLYMGECDPDYFLSGQYKKERWEQGIANKLYLFVGADSMYDPTRAPAGRYTALVEEFTCPWRHFSERDWLRMKREIVDQMLKEWQRVAPNVTEDNLIGAWISTPDDVINRNPCMHSGGWGALDGPAERNGRGRPIPELSNYRMPVKNFYLCSSAAHSAFGIGRGSSYCCYKVIVKDLGLSYKPWEIAGRPY
jgi:phytoene dehydrogenase-like protein